MSTIINSYVFSSIENFIPNVGYEEQHSIRGNTSYIRIILWINNHIYNKN